MNDTDRWRYAEFDSQSDAVQDLPDPTQQEEEDNGGSGWVAPLLALAELVLCLGAGVTVKFWPIFFLDPQAAALTPIQLNAVFCVSEQFHNAVANTERGSDSN